jgi:hypothetical protein
MMASSLIPSKYTKKTGSKIILVRQPRTGSTKLGYRCSDRTLRSIELLRSTQLVHHHVEWTRALHGKYSGTDDPSIAADWDGL